MKNLTLYILAFFAFSAVYAQKPKMAPADENGIPIFYEPDVLITAKGPSRKKRKQIEKQRRKFNKLRYAIWKTLPYAKEAAKNVAEIEKQAERLSAKDQKKFLHKKEEELFGEYEDDIRKMTKYQGLVLIKLIDREMDRNTYALIKDYKSGTSAFMWNGVGRIFGINLKEDYDAMGEEKAMEYIVKSMESGKNPSYFDYVAMK